MECDLGLDRVFFDWRRYTLVDRALIYEKPHTEDRRAHIRCVAALRKLTALQFGIDYEARGRAVIFTTRKGQRAYKTFKMELHIFLRECIFVLKSIPCLLAREMPPPLQVAFRYLDVRDAERRMSDALMSAAECDTNCALFARSLWKPFGRADYMHPFREDLIKLRDRIVMYRAALEKEQTVFVPPQLNRECEMVDRFMSLDVTAYTVYGDALEEEMKTFYEEILTMKDTITLQV